MAWTLPKAFVSSFNDNALSAAKRLLEEAAFDIPIDTTRRFVLEWEGRRNSIITQLEQASDRSALRTFCTCDEARTSRHRCIHVAAAILAVADEALDFRIPSSMRSLAPKCGPHHDDSFATQLRSSLGVGLGGLPEEVVARALGVHLGPSASRPGLQPIQAALDPDGRLDREWRALLEIVEYKRPPSGAKGRPTRLVYRLHARDHSLSWFKLAVEMVSEQAAGLAPGVANRAPGAAANGHSGAVNGSASTSAPLNGVAGHGGDSDHDDHDASERNAIQAIDGPAASAFLHPGTSRFNGARGSLSRLDHVDRELVLMILGASDANRFENGVFRIDDAFALPVIRALLRSGRCVVADSAKWIAGYGGMKQPAQVEGAQDPVAPAVWDEGQPWRVRLDLSLEAAAKQAGGTRSKKETSTGGRAVLSLSLVRGAQARPAKDALLILPDLAIFPEGAAAFASGGDSSWVPLAKQPLRVPLRSVPALLERLAAMPTLPPMHVDPGVARQCQIELPGCGEDGVAQPQRPHLHVVRAPGTSKLAATASLRSGPVALPVGGRSGCAIDVATRRIVARDYEADTKAQADLASVGLAQTTTAAEGAYRIAQRNLPQVVGHLSSRGWVVEADGNVLRAPGAFRSAVRWGVDWFDLEGEVEFGDATVSLGLLLESIRERRGVVTLADGSMGIVPQEWMQRLGLLARSGSISRDGARFAPAALLLLEAAMGDQVVDRDEATRQIRAGLRNFAGVEPVDPSSSFVGELRPYQREGLGWMRFLREFGLGGCLADDMGLGKTVQVLAMLDARRAERDTTGKGKGAISTQPRTSLVVAPRSLVFNWLSEARRFTPSLAVLDASGADRVIDAESFEGFDLVVTTYGILRRDIQSWRAHEFDYAILDEAQAIKNSSSQTATAAKLLKARHRLAMSGTPVENHLGELWSLVEFLNPALLGGGSGQNGHADGSSTASANGHLTNGTASNRTASRLRAADLTDPDAAAMAAKAVRPFILRRTKAQVAPQLPDRIEKTVACQLEGRQRKLYDTLKREVRSSIMGKVEEIGLKRAGVFVLEGLLRLRQAACHPGLLDKSRAGEPSAKLDSLVPTLSELVEEGHKTLVFSQFTSLLDLVEPRLQEAGLRWVRLDGSTRNRDERVREFQNDPACPVFLISLKAGGLGLNLTAADHVVLLDPWWNPAVEAQAIDRAHRIGQHRTVIATRLIAADTVEERILELQARKRALADAVMGGAQGPLASLTRNDLEALLA